MSKKLSFAIIDEEGRMVGDVELEKKSVKIIEDMLRIYCKYTLIKNE